MIVSFFLHVLDLQTVIEVRPISLEAEFGMLKENWKSLTTES